MFRKLTSCQKPPLLNRLSTRPKLRLHWLIIFCVSLVLMSNQAAAGAAEEFTPVEEDTYRAEVLEVDLQEGDDFTWGESPGVQMVTLQFIDGPRQGEEHVVENHLTGNPAFDIEVSEGDRVLVGEMDGSFHIMDFVRDLPLKWMLTLFLVSLLIVGGLKGLKVLVTLSLTGLAIKYIMIPGLLNGYNPVNITVLISAVVVALTALLLLGFGSKFMAAVGGTVLGTVGAAVVAHIFAGSAHLMGMHTQEAQQLYFTADIAIDFRGLLLAGFILGALGAIMDVCVSIASSVQEISKADPDMSFLQLFRSGLNVGKDVLGTMANTLILAYTGSALPLLLLLGVHPIDTIKLMNLDVIATEVVRALSGSIGMVLSVPATALLAAFLVARETPLKSDTPADGE